MKPEYLEIEEFKRVKTFMFSMNLFDLTLKQKQNYLNDKRLTKVEKEIVKCTIALKDCEYAEIIASLNSLRGQNELVESQRTLILGMAYNASGDCIRALAELESSLKTFHHFALKRYEFYALLQLFFVHYNLKDKNSMASILDQMKDLETEDPKDQISFLRCQFNYHSYAGQMEKAKFILEKIEQSIPHMHSSQIIPHLVDRFVYQIKTDNFIGCESTLIEMKEFRRFNYSPNYKFMKTLLSHFLHKKPIYLYDKDFSDCPLLLFQLKTIRAYESGDKTEAQLHWQKLHEINPDIYTDQMEYKGDKCLFSLCLNLYTQKPQTHSEVEESLSLEEKLMRLLTQGNGPVKKEDLFFQLWKKPLDTKEDLAKLSMMVTRIKKKSGLDIVSRKGCYLIQKSSQSA